MALEIVAGPGCDDVKMPYVEARRRPGDVVISAGAIFKAITASDAIPSSNSAALRLALYLRAVAIRQARERQLDGFVLTSNGARADLDRLVRDTGAPGVTVLTMTEAQACARIAQIVPAGERRAACDEGIKRRWFGRFQPSATDREVAP